MVIRVGKTVCLYICMHNFYDIATRSYDCGVIVARSIELGEPVVCASMNYRQVSVLVNRAISLTENYAVFPVRRILTWKEAK